MAVFRNYSSGLLKLELLCVCMLIILSALLTCKSFRVICFMCQRKCLEFAFIAAVFSTLFSKFSAPTIAFLAFDWLKSSDYEPIVGVLRHMENSAPSLKIFRTTFSTLVLYNGRNKNRRQNPV